MNERELVIRLAERVRDITIDYLEKYEDYAEILTHRPRDVTRKIDMIAENALDEAIKEECICARIISEEIGERVVPENGMPEYTLVFDPVDGSNNLVSGIPYFCSSIALSKVTKDAKYKDISSSAVAGAYGGTYSAEKGKGSCLNGKPIHTSAFTGKPKYSIYAYGSGRIPKGIILLEEEDCIVRTLGSVALDICMVARGSFHAMIDSRYKVSGYDIMAAGLILEESGGTITDMMGYSLSETPVNSTGLSIVCAAGQQPHDRIVRFLKM